MVRQAVRIGLVLSLAAWSAWSAGDGPPVKCGKRNAGTFWPPEANTDAALLRQAGRCGTLRYCGRATFGWKWQAMTVNVQSLQSKPADEKRIGAGAACMAEPVAQRR